MRLKQSLIANDKNKNKIECEMNSCAKSFFEIYFDSFCMKAFTLTCSNSPESHTARAASTSEAAPRFSPTW